MTNLFNSSLSQMPDGIWDFCFNTSTKSPSLIEFNHVFWVEGIGLSLISLIGIVGNLTTVIVLHRISLNNVFNQVSLDMFLHKVLINSLTLRCLINGEVLING